MPGAVGDRRRLTRGRGQQQDGHPSDPEHLPPGRWAAGGRPGPAHSRGDQPAQVPCRRCRFRDGPHSPGSPRSGDQPLVVALIFRTTTMAAKGRPPEADHPVQDALPGVQGRVATTAPAPTSRAGAGTQARNRSRPNSLLRYGANPQGGWLNRMQRERGVQEGRRIIRHGSASVRNGVGEHGDRHHLQDGARRCRPVGVNHHGRRPVPPHRRLPGLGSQGPARSRRTAIYRGRPLAVEDAAAALAATGRGRGADLRDGPPCRRCAFREQVIRAHRHPPMTLAPAVGPGPVVWPRVSTTLRLSSSTTSPKMVCARSQVVGATVTKNWGTVGAHPP